MTSLPSLSPEMTLWNTPTGSRPFRCCTLSGITEILAAEQTLEHSGWFEGTADAVRKNMVHFKSQRPTHYIILSGDQLYRMNLKTFMESHIESGADITIATTAVTRQDASGFGIMKIDSNHKITAFQEKPAPTLNIDDWKIPENARGTLPSQKEYLASMGIYIFNADANLPGGKRRNLYCYPGRI